MHEVFTANHQQIVQFLNTMFISFDPANDKVHEQKPAMNGEMLLMLWKYTEILNNMNVTLFGNWCSSKECGLFDVQTEKKVYCRLVNDLCLTTIHS